MSADLPRSVPDPGFAGDDGSPDPRLAEALAAYDGRSSGGVLLALQDARLLVPVVAVLGDVEYDTDGLAHDKTSDMATVLLTRPDGRTGLLAFSGTAALATWRADARPVPVPTRTAAQAALQEGADSLVVDVAGPVTFAVADDDLRALAAGWRLTRIGGGGAERTGWIRPAGESGGSIPG